MKATLKGADGLVVNLTTANGVRFHMRQAAGGSVSFDKAAVIENAVGGAVRYDWAAGDTAVPGDYWADFEVTWGDGTVTTFPNSGYLEVRVVAELV